jgi:hypothetical protein
MVVWDATVLVSMSKLNIFLSPVSTAKLFIFIKEGPELTEHEWSSLQTSGVIVGSVDTVYNPDCYPRVNDNKDGDVAGNAKSGQVTEH